MLWPSSMFWMLLATASAVVPSTQPALPLLAPIASRAATEASLKRDSALDVCPVIFTARILDVAADRLQLASERLEVRIAELGVFGYVCDGHRRLTDIQATWRAAFAGRRTSSWDSTAPTSWSRSFLVVVSVGWVS